MGKETKNNDIGKRIRRFREHRGMKAAELAELLEVSVSSVYAYENGDVMPPVATVSAIAEILSVSMNMIIFGIPCYPEDLEFAEKEGTEEENTEK